MTRPIPLHVVLLTVLSSALAPAVAQMTRVVPSENATVEGNSSNRYPFSYPSAKLQVLIDAPRLTTGQGLITAFAFRADGQSRSTWTGHTKAYSFTFHTTLTSAASMSIDPIANAAGATPTIVASGAFSLPTSTPPPTLPRPFAFRVPLPMPYVYAGNVGNLLMTIETTDTTAVPTDAWRLDAVNESITGTNRQAMRVEIGEGCANGAGDRLTLALSGGLLGGTLDATPTLTAAFAFAQGLLLVGFTNAAPGLPLDLSFVGLGGCTLHVEPLVAVPLTSTGGVVQPVSIPVPATPNAFRVPVYLQSIALMSGRPGLQDAVVSPGMVALLDSPIVPTVREQSIFYSASLGRYSISATARYVPVLQFEGVFP